MSQLLRRRRHGSLPKAGAGRKLVIVLLYILAAAILCGCAFALARRHRLTEQRLAAEALSAEVGAIAAIARAEAAAAVQSASASAREQALEARRQAHEESVKSERELHAREDALMRKLSTLNTNEQRVLARATAIQEREQGLKQLDQKKRDFDEQRKQADEARVKMLEEQAGETRRELRDRLVGEWVQEAKARAADELRHIEQGLADAEHGREAKRVMGIAIQRYHGHYLTERLLSNLPLMPGLAAKLSPDIPALEEVANIKVTISDDQTSVRLEGQDSFGREIARRAIRKLEKSGWKGEAKPAVERIKEELEREVVELGRRAFKELEIPRAHPDIVKLVGRLNWRTSYTQNQWKHAVEAAFLCGMMANELGLDVKIARRAALMHDIGKSLTHAIDGSHAVIGADYARRLGESELVANAIGAHHADEPCNSVYASLVAAADAMSGARPGARREQTDNYVQKLEDLERIGGSFNGVERAFAVQGGREVRIYVQENRVNDERAVELSSEIARRISDEMTFPGQIKVTVIRELRAIEVAG
ncbi:MAG TPA: Rnase Y domain-containing protein [Polyangia bacterium]|nr:Rnase Y domain-containing protein [Polyangia bacterium]